MTNVTNNLTGLFGAGTQTASSNNQLTKTGHLTTVAEGITREIFTKLNASPEEYQSKIINSQQSHDSMDNLIAECFELTSVDLEFLKDVTEEDFEKMIRSQQSKRSRSKSKVMTVENYSIMMTGAIAENLLRIAANKHKSSGGASSRATEVELSEEELQKLQDNQEDLKKAIRNIQSKKSIAKSKANFDETSEYWAQLLATEKVLIALRDGGKNNENPEAIAALDKVTKVDEILNGIEDINMLKASDAKSTLELIKSMLKGE